MQWSRQQQHMNFGSALEFRGGKKSDGDDQVINDDGNISNFTRQSKK